MFSNLKLKYVMTLQTGMTARERLVRPTPLKVGVQMEPLLRDLEEGLLLTIRKKTVVLAGNQVSEI